MTARMLVLLIILVGFFVRVWGIDFGLPNHNLIDEQELIYSAFYSGSEGLKPLRYLDPPLTQYLLLIEYGFYYIVGSFENVSTFFISYLSNASSFLLIGRITMAIIGTATIYVLWLIGKKYFSKNIGLLASLFLAVSFLHAKESHYIKQDVMSTLFVLASFYFVLNILKSGKVKNYVLSGIFSGLALATKYQTGLFFPVIILAHFLRSKKKSLNNLVPFFVATAGAFILANPYVVLDFPGTLAGLLREYPLVQTIVISQQGKPIWLFYLSEHIPEGVGWLTMLASFVGFTICFVKGKTEKKYLLVPILPLIFLVTVSFWTKFHQARYAMMTLPFFALGAAIFLDWLVTKIKNPNMRKAILVASISLLIYQPLSRIIKFDYIITVPDTRQIANSFIEQNVVSGSSVLVETAVRPEYPAFFSTPLNLDKESLDKRIKDAQDAGFQAKYLKLLKEANEGKVGFDITATSRVDILQDPVDPEYEKIDGPEIYKERGIEYLVLSSWAIKPDIKPKFIEAIKNYYQLIAEFKPNPEFRSDPHLVRMDYAALDQVNIFSKDLTFGPVVQVYKLEDK